MPAATDSSCIVLRATVQQKGVCAKSQQAPFLGYQAATQQAPYRGLMVLRLAWSCQLLLELSAFTLLGSCCKPSQAHAAQLPVQGASQHGSTGLCPAKLDCNAGCSRGSASSHHACTTCESRFLSSSTCAQFCGMLLDRMLDSTEVLMLSRCDASQLHPTAQK